MRGSAFSRSSGEPVMWKFHSFPPCSTKVLSMNVRPGPGAVGQLHHLVEDERLPAVGLPLQASEPARQAALVRGRGRGKPLRDAVALLPRHDRRPPFERKQAGLFAFGVAHRSLRVAEPEIADYQ